MQTKISIKFVIGVGVLLLSLAPFLSYSSQAATRSELEKQKQAAQQKMREAQEKAAQKKKEAEELQAIVAKLDADITATQAKINSTQSQIEKTQKEIQDTEAQIAQKEKELKTEQENQNETIRVIYETVNKSTLEILASAEDISEVIKYGDYLEGLENQIEDTIAKIEKIKNELNSQKSALEKKKTDLENYKNQQEAYRNSLAAEEKNKSEVLQWTRQEVVNYQNEVAAALKDIAAINATLARLDTGGGGSNCGGSGFLVSEGAVVKRGQQIGWQGNSGFSTGSHLHFGVYNGGAAQNPRNYLGGALSWPLPSPRVTQEFGCTDFAQCGNPNGPYRGGPHPGIDLSSYYLAPVLAAEDGVVISTTRSCSGYGNHIYILGNSGLITLYAHLD